MKKIMASWALVFLAAGVVNTSALDRHVQINNVSSHDIVEFYASNTGTQDWQEDILGSDILPSGSSVMINIDDGTGYCKYDFLAITADGSQAIVPDNNVCELAEFDFTD
jgi:hypothetical protein